MSPSEIVQVYECSRCGYRYQSPLEIGGAWCPKHKNESRIRANVALKCIWTKADGGKPPTKKKER